MTIPLSILTMHFVADFLFQSDWMALNKSKSNEALTLHALTYSALFLPWGLSFAVFTFLTHWATDFLTSRCTSKLWFMQPIDDSVYSLYRPRYLNVFGSSLRHWFFVAIGADQLIHFTTLALTYRFLFGA